MNKLLLILKRLRKPQVIMSIISQIIIILTLLRVNVNIDLVTGITTSVCTILVLLGVLSNPDDGEFGYCDDVSPCRVCGKNTCHVNINGASVCRECGAAQKQGLPAGKNDAGK